jgi:hypothetical protein
VEQYLCALFDRSDVEYRVPLFRTTFGLRLSYIRLSEVLGSRDELHTCALNSSSLARDTAKRFLGPESVRRPLYTA